MPEPMKKHRIKNNLDLSIIEREEKAISAEDYFTLTGRDMYRMLVVERGWTSDEYEKWLTQLLVKSLLDTGM